MGSPGPALVLTFDNLGEASELERGTWPAEEPIGRHRSVTEVLPRLLDLLDARGLAATFFVEAINCELYPEALLEIAARGHEIGMHGWCHEDWAQLPVDRESELLERGVDAFAGLGIAVRGFRPPGGGVRPSTATALRANGLDWCSPAGGAQELRDGIAWVPFDWELVDAYHLMARFLKLRLDRGDGPQPLAPEALTQRLIRKLAGADGQARTLILHPFLMLDAAWFHGAAALLAAIVRAPSPVMSGGHFAERIRVQAR
jgi:peptidoglycan/xylan/chitin deacetylase (PgdA/CDA1 family)